MTPPTGGRQAALPVTQLLLRNIGRLESRNLLLLGAPRDEALVAAFGARRGALVTFDYGACLLYTSPSPRD